METHICQIILSILILIRDSLRFSVKIDNSKRNIWNIICVSIESRQPNCHAFFGVRYSGKKYLAKSIPRSNPSDVRG